MSQSELIHEEITSGIIRCFYHVHNTLGHGFLEKVYENAMRITLVKEGFFVEQQKPVAVRFESELVGDYFADLLVEGKVIIELKAAECIAPDMKPS